MTGSAPSPLLGPIQRSILLVIAVGLALVLTVLRGGMQSSSPMEQLARRSPDPEQALTNGRPTVMEFYADWCQVCREMAPAMLKLEQAHRDRLDVVMVNVRSVAEMGAYVSLQEYDNIGGMILLSELSRRRIRSINKLIRVGRQECVVVLRVDPNKGYIDLSKRRVSTEEIRKCEDRYNKGKAVNQIIRHVAETTGYDMEELYKRTAWHFDKKFGSSYDAFKLSITDPDTVFEGVELDAKVKDLLLHDIRKRLTPQPVSLDEERERKKGGECGVRRSIACE